MAALLQAATGINGGDDILSKMSSRSVFPALSSERKNSPYMLRVLRSGPDIPGLPRSEDLIRKAHLVLPLVIGFIICKTQCKGLGSGHGTVDTAGFHTAAKTLLFLFQNLLSPEKSYCCIHDPVLLSEIIFCDTKKFSRTVCPSLVSPKPGKNQKIPGRSDQGHYTNLYYIS